MNKLLFVALIAITSIGFSNCGTYHSATNRNNVSSSMLGKIGNVLIQDLGKTVLANAGSSNLLGKLNMGTKLNTIIKGATMVSSFKNMLTNNYGISANKVNDAYGSFGTLKDVTSFIGQNASKTFLSKL